MPGSRRGQAGPSTNLLVLLSLPHLGGDSRGQERPRPPWKLPCCGTVTQEGSLPMPPTRGPRASRDVHSWHPKRRKGRCDRALSCRNPTESQRSPGCGGAAWGSVSGGEAKKQEQGTGTILLENLLNLSALNTGMLLTFLSVHWSGRDFYRAPWTPLSGTCISSSPFNLRSEGLRAQSPPFEHLLKVEIPAPRGPGRHSQVLPQ